MMTSTNTTQEATTMAETNDYEERAAAIGARMGKNAASWVFDGNTTDETYRTVLAGIEDGDPMVMDRFREPSLSGEFADDYSLADLQDDLGIEIDWTRDDVEEMSELADECARAWEDAARDAFWQEIESEARRMLS